MAETAQDGTALVQVQRQRPAPVDPADWTELHPVEERPGDPVGGQ